MIWGVHVAVPPNCPNFLGVFEVEPARHERQDFHGLHGIHFSCPVGICYSGLAEFFASCRSFEGYEPPPDRGLSSKAGLQHDIHGGAKLRDSVTTGILQPPILHSAEL